MNQLDPMIKAAIAFCIACCGIAMVVFTIVGSLALRDANGPEQTCARSGGHWVQHYDSTSPIPNAWIDDKECKR